MKTWLAASAALFLTTTATRAQFEKQLRILDPVLLHAPLSAKAGHTSGQNAATSEESLPARP